MACFFGQENVKKGKKGQQEKKFALTGSVIIGGRLCAVPVFDKVLFFVHGRRRRPRPVISPPVRGRAPPPLWAPASPPPLDTAVTVSTIEATVWTTVKTSIAVPVNGISLFVTVVPLWASAGATGAFAITTTSRTMRGRGTPVVTPNGRRRVLGPLRGP